MTCEVRMTSRDYKAIEKCESLVVREYEREDGSRFAVPVAWGDEEEMKIQAAIPGIFVIPMGLALIGHAEMLVSELFRNEAKSIHRGRVDDANLR